MKAVTTTITPCGRVLLSVRLHCGCCSADVLLDVVEAHQLAACLYADVVIAAHILTQPFGAWVHPEVSA